MTRKKKKYSEASLVAAIKKLIKAGEDDSIPSTSEAVEIEPALLRAA